MPDLNEKFEARHLTNIKKLQKKVRKQYEKTIDKIFAKAGSVKLKSPTFKITDYPTLSSEIDKALLAFNEELNLLLLNGVKSEWDLSIDKNASIILNTYGASRVSEVVKTLLYDPHYDALESFAKRKISGLGLSDRVWKYTNQFRKEIEENLYAGLSEGRSAAEMARDQKKYLQQPERLFRRVEDADGKLVLSRAARNYNPNGKGGRGIYRSSYKNAFRLTRTTVNDAYRESDMDRYRTIPFITGYEIKLAENHPKYDICDVLKGEYPKSFTWRKWHVQCICYCVSKLPPVDEYDKFEDAILNGTHQEFKFSDQVNTVNPAIGQYITENRFMLDRLKRKPDWMLDNGLK